MLLRPAVLATALLCSALTLASLRTAQVRAATATAQATIVVDGRGTGRRFDGVGAISGGGGNSRLLIDYPEPERSAILDYLFKPGYGADLQIFKVEIGGDANSTDGAEPSIEHTPGAVNCNAGYEWWLMEQAKARNPNVKLYALAWAAPGWLDTGEKFWSPDVVNYLLTWLGCAKSHGLTIDYIGGWNERGYDARWYEELSAALKAHGYPTQIVADDSSWDEADAMTTDPAFASAVDILGAHYPCGYLSASLKCQTTANALATGKPLWASENGSLDDDSGAAPLVRSIVRGYVDARLTAYVNWPAIAAITPNLPYPTVGLMVASEPWSGNYSIGKSLWATAQFTQFTAPGWHFVDASSGYLGGERANGGYVTLVAPNGRDWSTIVETSTASQPQRVRFAVRGGLSASNVYVWATDLQHTGASSVSLEQVADAHGNHFSLTLLPGYVYTVTSTTGQGKSDAVSPPSAELALPYADDLRGYAWGDEPRYLSAMQGAFEVQPCIGGRSGACIRQMVAQKPIEWQDDSDAFALLGDVRWQDYTVSVDALFAQPGTIELLGRANVQQRPQSHQAGYYLRLSDRGRWSLSKRDVKGAFTILSHGTIAAPGLDSWHTLALTFAGASVSASVDGRKLATIGDDTYASGQVGIGVDGYQTDEFDRLTVTP